MRRILHIDMDAFYASVEQRDNPSLRGKPVAVGGDPTVRGVVAAASYEARTFGVRSAIPMSRAVRLCPSLVIVRPDFHKYRAISQQIFDIYREVTPLVEPLSLDEAYLDVTRNNWNESLGVNVARRLKERIKEATNLTASAGVAPNKFLAKIASGWKKPDGLTVVAPERVERFLQGLPVDALWGVGPVTAGRLREHGIEKLIDVRAKSASDLEAIVGSLASWLIDLAHGRDDRAVEPNRPSKSAGSEETYADDLVSMDEIRHEIDTMARDIAGWLARKQKTARPQSVQVALFPQQSQYSLVVITFDREKKVPVKTMYYRDTLNNLVKMRRESDHVLVGRRWLPTRITMENFAMRNISTIELQWSQAPDVAPELFQSAFLGRPSNLTWPAAPAQ